MLNYEETLFLHKEKVSSLLKEIKEIEANTHLSFSDKNEKLKIIKAELNKIGEDIARIKKEINIKANFKIN